MSDAGLQLPSYPEGSTPSFSVQDTFNPNGASNVLLTSAAGDVFFALMTAEGHDAGGGHMVSILLPHTDVTLTVLRSFASGYLILHNNVTGAQWFATLVQPKAS